MIGERYRIVRPIGAGGMGEVYLARDVTLGLATWRLAAPVPLVCDNAGAAAGAALTWAAAPLVATLNAAGGESAQAAALIAAGVARRRGADQAAAQAACRARVDGGWSEPLYQRAGRCLAIQRQVALGQLAGAATRDAASDVIQRALPLPSPAACVDPAQQAGRSASRAATTPRAGSRLRSTTPATWPPAPRPPRRRSTWRQRRSRWTRPTRSRAS